MKIPKKLNICGKEWTVKTEANSGGAAFCDSPVPTITIGLYKPKWILENILHEILEIILVERGHRYSKYGEEASYGDILFIMTHEEFINVAKDLECVVAQIMKYNGIKTNK